MKKLLTVLLTLAMLVTCLSGCLFSSTSLALLNVTIEETVLYDKNGIVIVATSLEESIYGYDLNIRIENNTDKNIMIEGEAITVNGISVYGDIWQEVAAGKKANSSITLYEEDMVLAGINRIATVSGYDFRIIDSDIYYDDENADTEEYATLDRFSFTLETSAADSYVQEIDESGEVLYQQGDITVILQECTDNLLTCSVKLLIKNDSDTTLNVTSDDVAANDYMVNADDYMVYASIDTLVCPDSVCYCELQMDPSELDNNDDDEPDRITFSLAFSDLNTYETIFKTPELEINLDEK